MEYVVRTWEFINHWSMKFCSSANGALYLIPSLLRTILQSEFLRGKF